MPLCLAAPRTAGEQSKKYEQCSEKRHRAVSVSKKLHSHSPNFIIAPTALLIPYYVQQYLSLSCGSTPSTSSFQQGTSGQFACTCVHDCMHIFYFILYFCPRICPVEGSNKRLPVTNRIVLKPPKQQY
jgi:hypothetical protein